jgi:O-antigen ligase
MIGATQRNGTILMSASAAASRGAGAPPTTSGLERLAYGGLLAFVVLLYSNIGVVVPALAPLQLTKLVAFVALAALVIGRVSRGAALRLDAPQTILVFGLLVLAACSVYGALWPGLALKSLMDFAKMGAVYLLIVHVVDRPERFRRVAGTIIVCSLVPAMATLWRAALGISLVDGHRAAWVGLFEDPNELAYSLVILVPLAMTLFDTARSRRARVVYAIAAVIQVAAVVATQSRGGVLGLVVVLGLLLWSYRIRGGVLAIVVLVAVVGFAFAADTFWQRVEVVATYQQDDAITSRIQAWRVGVDIFLNRPMLGVGIGNFALAWPLYADSPGGKWLTAHNAFIQILGELGIMGLIGFAMLLAVTLIGLRRTRRQATRVGARERESFAKGLGIALWGYASCAMLLSVAFNWFFYLIVALSVAVIGMARTETENAPTGAAWGGRARSWG